MERVLYLASRGDTALVKAAMQTLEQTTKLNLKDAAFFDLLKPHFESARVEDEGVRFVEM